MNVEPSIQTPPRRLSVGLCTIGAVVLSIGLSRLEKLQEPDIWWHLRMGEWLWQHHALPAPDPFSHTVTWGVKYAEVLAELYYWAAYRLAGSAGIIWGQAFFSAVLLWLVARLSARYAPTNPFSVSLCLALVGLAIGWRLYPRTETFSYLCWTGLLLALDRAERDGTSRSLQWMPALFLLWANLHRAGTTGLLAFLLTVFFWSVRRDRRTLALRAGGILVASGAALLVNPAGLGYIAAGFDLLTRTSYQALLPEWQPIGLTFFTEHPAVAALLLLWAFQLIRTRTLTHSVGIAAMSLCLAWYSARFIAFAMIASVPLVTAALVWLGETLSSRLEAWVRPSLLRATSAMSALCLVVGAYVQQPVAYWGTGVAWWRLPVRAAEFLRDAPPPGKMFNSFAYGGYLLFALGPEMKVYIDGRNDTLYPDEFFRQAVLATQDSRLLNALLEHWNIDFAVLYCPEMACARYVQLHRDPGWALVHLDDQAAVLVRRTAQSAAYIERWGYTALRAPDAQEQLLEMGEASRPALIHDVMTLVQRSPDSIRAHYLAALLYRALGNPTLAEAERSMAIELAALRGAKIALP